MSNLVKLDIDYTVQLVECSLHVNGDNKPHTVLNTKADLQAKYFRSNNTGERISADDLVASAATVAGAKEWSDYIPDAEKAKTFQNGQAEFDMTIPYNFPKGDIEFRKESHSQAVDQARLKIHFRLSQKKQ